MAKMGFGNDKIRVVRVLPHKRCTVEIAGKTYHFKSQLERDWARYLQLLKEHEEIGAWEYEPEVFYFESIKRGTRSYTPDFRVTHNDGSIEYHEVKGWMDQKSRTKLKRMAKYYPDVPIVLVDKDAYYAIRDSVSALIPNWE